MYQKELLKCLKERFFIAEMKSQTKEEVLEELIQPLVDHDVIKNKLLLLNTLKQRESLGSTGIGKGVGVPHCRTLAVPDIHIVVGLSDKGVDFDAIDKKSVYLFFLIVAPPKEDSCIYLPILGTLVEKVNNDTIREQLLKAKNFDGFVNAIAGGE